MNSSVSLAVAQVALAAAITIGDPAPAPIRLRALRAAAQHAGPPAATPPLRPAWILVGAVAPGALGWAVGGPTVAVVLAVTAGVTLAYVARRAATRTGEDGEVELAGRWELIAVCLRAGLPVPAAVQAGAEPLTGSTGARLRRVAGLLALGADPADAWRSVADVPALATFARAAARSAGTGAALAEVATAEGGRIRAAITDSAHARAQRAAVMITGPLGLCFLPAFLVLGVGPVVIGLAGAVLSSW